MGEPSKYEKKMFDIEALVNTKFHECLRGVSWVFPMARAAFYGATYCIYVKTIPAKTLSSGASAEIDQT